MKWSLDVFNCSYQSEYHNIWVYRFDWAIVLIERYCVGLIYWLCASYVTKIHSKLSLLVVWDKYYLAHGWFELQAFINIQTDNGYR